MGWKLDLVIRKARPFSIEEMQRRTITKITSSDDALAPILIADRDDRLADPGCHPVLGLIGVLAPERWTREAGHVRGFGVWKRGLGPGPDRELDRAAAVGRVDEHAVARGSARAIDAVLELHLAHGGIGLRVRGRC